MWAWARRHWSSHQPCRHGLGLEPQIHLKILVVVVVAFVAVCCAAQCAISLLAYFNFFTFAKWIVMKWNGACCHWLATYDPVPPVRLQPWQLVAIKSYSLGASQLEIYNFCTKSRHVCSVFLPWVGDGNGDGDSCYSELFLLVLLGWKHSPMMGDCWCRRPDVGQLMPNGFQVSSPIMRITAKTAANKTHPQPACPARQLSEASTQSYLHLGSPHVCSAPLCSACFPLLLMPSIICIRNTFRCHSTRALMNCERGKFMDFRTSFSPRMRMRFDWAIEANKYGFIPVKHQVVFHLV